MKVLLAYPDSNTVDNPFVFLLKRELEKLGCDISWGLDQFWTNYVSYDVIHINWPNSLFENWSPTKVEVLHLEKVLSDIKQRGIKLVYTRHNERPHYTSNSNILKCYKLVEENADAIVHLGDSNIEYNDRCENKKHYVIPHHVYDIYDTNITQEEARKKLNISTRKFVILTFGAYRDIEETKLVLDTYRKLDLKGRYLLAPRIGEPLGLSEVYLGIGRRWLLNKIEKAKFWWRNIKISDGYISDKDLPLYFQSADVVLIQRKDILNSGNLPLAYFFKKVVVGPDSGNVGEILKETDNFMFNPNIKDSLEESLKKAYNSDRITLGEKNYNYATLNWNSFLVAKKYLRVYEELCC